jgi:hypothetical protein
MTPLICSALFLLPTSCATPKKVAVRKAFTYALDSKATSEKNISEVALRNTSNGRVLWKQRVTDYAPSQVVWSKDHRALLIDLHGELLIWRVGKPLLKALYAGVPYPEGLDRYDYTMGIKWSPDARRLLIGFGMSGMGDMGYFRLFCLTFWGNRYKYTVLPVDGYTRDMGWRSNRVAFYCPAEGNGGQIAGKPRPWHVP